MASRNLRHSLRVVIPDITRERQAGQHIIYTTHVLAVSSICECIGVAAMVAGEDGNGGRVFA
jgi:hypothetical protein